MTSPLPPAPALEPPAPEPPAFSPGAASARLGLGLRLLVQRLGHRVRRLLQFVHSPADGLDVLALGRLLQRRDCRVDARLTSPTGTLARFSLSVFSIW